MRTRCREPSHYSDVMHARFDKSQPTRSSALDAPGEVIPNRIIFSILSRVTACF